MSTDENPDGAEHGADAERNFLDHYFGSVYDKLEADALLFNRKLPHAGLVGAENENALAALLRNFLPPRFGLEVSGIVIDRHGNQSRQCDIIIYDAHSFPKYLRKVFPVEIVHGVIEVKTTLSAQEAQSSRDNLASVAALDFRPRLTPYWKTRTLERLLPDHPPHGFVFGFRSDVVAFETFASWFPFAMTLDGRPLLNHPVVGPEIRTVAACSLDKGVIRLESTNPHPTRFLLLADQGSKGRHFEATARGTPVLVDPAKTLFLFLETLWQRVSTHRVHPGFDIRSYMSALMDMGLNMSGPQEETPENYYMVPDPGPGPETVE